MIKLNPMALIIIMIRMYSYHDKDANMDQAVELNEVN